MGEIPLGALAGGRERTAERLYLCQALHKGGLHPGKIRSGFGGGNISWGGQEISVRDYAVLVPSWTDVPDIYPFVGGVESDRKPLDVCRGYYRGGIHPGEFRADFAGCHIGFAGGEVSVLKYELLGTQAIH